jgi:ankyrin repeat protein
MRAWLEIKWAGENTGRKNITPLHIAARYGLTDFARSLVKQGAIFDTKDAHGKTALWWAAAKGHTDFIKLMVQAGAIPDVDDKICGLEPIHEAAKQNHSEAVHALSEAGVDPLTRKMCENPGKTWENAPRLTGHTPLMAR